MGQRSLGPRWREITDMSRRGNRAEQAAYWPGVIPVRRLKSLRKNAEFSYPTAEAMSSEALSLVSSSRFAASTRRFWT